MRRRWWFFLFLGMIGCSSTHSGIPHALSPAEQQRLFQEHIMTQAEWDALMQAAGDVDSISCQRGFNESQRTQALIKLYRQHPECVMSAKIDRHGHLWVWYRDPGWHGCAVYVSPPDCDYYN